MATTKPKSKAVARARKKQPPWLWIGVAGLVAVLLVAAIVSSGGSDEKESSAQGVEEIRPVTVAGTALPEFEPGGADSAVGQTIPEVKGQSFDGSPVTIGNDGRSKLIVFVAHWCPHCQKEIPLLADWLESNSLPGGVDLYTVSTGVTDKRPNYPPSKWLKKEGWTAKTLADSAEQQAADAFGLSAFPYFVAVDGSGKVVARTSGEITTGQFAELAQSALSNR
ncbi:MAG TPA: TlpA disulfide reductase family protein [Acidimicrobiia bacterium]|jgi:cytochrome c biogenesis protein CcmG/thiol:disulfide interchange protein DsbE|nr:TlpA disulfide reductase family protein [Acidimicrobiia bacterium]